MKTVQVREAKAGFSALVEAAEKGEPTIVTKHGRPAAMVVPVAEGRKLYPNDNDRFIDFLLAYPGGVEIERNQSSLRDFDF
jgi:prevent-host-death family protein